MTYPKFILRLYLIIYVFLEAAINKKDENTKNDPEVQTHGPNSNEISNVSGWRWRGTTKEADIAACPTLSSTIPLLSSWGHYMVGLKGGSPRSKETSAPKPIESSNAFSAVNSAKLDKASETPKKLKCQYCDYSTDIFISLKRHKIACKKEYLKKEYRDKGRASSIPRNKEALTKDLAPGDTREFVEYESSPTSLSTLDLGKCKLLKKELHYNRDFKEVLTNSSATSYEKYMLCRAANICVPDVYPFINMRKNSKQFTKTAKFCLIDTNHLLDIIQSSPNRLSESDGRKFILADTYIRIKDINGDFRGKELRPNAFMRIEIISTENPNHVKLVLNGSENPEDDEVSEDDEEESWTEKSFEAEKISIAHCWGSLGKY
jgi:hypothetical protein